MKTFVCIPILLACLNLLSQPSNIEEISSNYQSFYDGYRAYLKEDAILNWGIFHGVYELRIDLPNDRTKYGKIILGRWDSKNFLSPKKFKKILGPFRVLGRANSTSNFFNSDTNEYYSNSPLGDYYGWCISTDMMSLVFPTLSTKDLGDGGAMILVKNEKISRANQYLDPKRKELIIHGGEMQNGHLKPTYGGLRMSNEDMKKLVTTIQYLRVGGNEIKGKSVEDMELHINSQVPGISYDGLRTSLVVRIRETGNFLKENGLELENDGPIKYSPNYVDPIPVSNYKTFENYTFIKSMGERGYLNQVSFVVNRVKYLDSEYSSGSLNKSNYIENLESTIDFLTKVHQDLSLYTKQNSVEQTELYTNTGLKTFNWVNYLDEIWNYIKTLRTYTTGLKTNSNKPGPNDTCFMIDSQCNIILLTCKYKCYPSGIVYEESCGVCFLISF